MTVSSLTTKNSYSGDGSTTTFAYGFKIFASSEIKVFIRSSTGTETLKTLTTHYTLTNIGNASGGNVVFESGSVPTATETVVLIRDTALTQTLDLVENDPFLSGSFEDSLDKVTHQMIEIQEEVDRSFKVSKTNSITTSEFTDSATDRASKTLGFDSDGNLTTVADFLPKGGDSAQFTYSTTTTDSDPGAGVVRFNNSTIGSATIAYIDDLDAAGTDVSAWVQSFDDVAGNATNRGRIRVSKSNTLDTWHVFKVSGAVTDASGYSKVALTYIDGAGTLANNDKVFISFVASGEDGTIPGYYYKFDTGTSDADPGAGEIRFNNGTYASATAIYIDDADAHGVTTSTDVLTWDDSDSTIRGHLHIVDINDSSTYARFNITGASTDASGYNKLAVTHVASNNTFSAADELSVHFSRSGNAGTAASIAVNSVTANTVSAGGSATAAVANAGSSSAANFNFTFGLPTGATGATGASGTNSQLAMTWNSSTSDADPGGGKIAFNHGTVSSVSVLYVDDADDASADISGFVQSWDDVSNTTAKGIVTITKEGTPATYALFKISGSVTDASGYNKVAVTHIASNGSFSNNDGVGVHFSYSGNDGSDGDGIGDMNDVIDDTSPQLGGNLDMNGKDIVTTSNADIDLAPHGTGKVVVKGNTNPGTVVFNCESNSHGQTVKSQPHSASVTNVLTLPPGGDGELVSTVATQTLTNKSIVATQLTGTIANARLDQQLQDVAGLAVTDGNIIVGDGSNFVAENGATARASLGLTIGTHVQAYNADTVSKDEQNTFTKAQLASTQTANATGSVTLDFDTYQNFILTFTGNVTLAAPSTEASQVGQTGVIIIKQDGTGSRTLSLHGDYETPSAGGVGTISTAANAVDIVPYCVLADNRILLGAVQIAFG
jgi:hypothetical protein